MEKTEITVEELSRLEPDSVVLVDLRDAVSYEYGHIPGAVNITKEAVFERIKAKDKTICLYCRNGVVGLAAAEELSPGTYAVNESVWRKINRAQ